MTDDIIQRDTGTLRIASFSPFVSTEVVDTGGFSTATEDEGIHDLIELESRDSSSDILTDHIEDSGSESRSFCDPLDLLGSLDSDF